MARLRRTARGWWHHPHARTAPTGSLDRRVPPVVRGAMVSGNARNEDPCRTPVVQRSPRSQGARRSVSKARVAPARCSPCRRRLPFGHHHPARAERTRLSAAGGRPCLDRDRFAVVRRRVVVGCLAHHGSIPSLPVLRRVTRGVGGAVFHHDEHVGDRTLLSLPQTGYRVDRSLTERDHFHVLELLAEKPRTDFPKMRLVVRHHEPMVVTPAVR